MRSLAKNPHFWPSQSLKKVLFTAQGWARLRTGPIITQIPRGYQKKKSLLCRKSAILSIRWEFQFLDWWGGFLKKVLVLVQRPQHKSTPDPVAAPKNIPFGTIFIEFGDTKKCCTFSGLELAPKSRNKLIGALSCMHKGPKCIQSLWDHPKKIPFVKKHKEGAICAIFREKFPFLAFPEAKKGVVHCARLRKAAQGCTRLRTGPIITQIPRGYQKKKFIV